MVDRQNVTSTLGGGDWISASHFSAVFDSFCVLGPWRAQPLLAMASSESISTMSEWLRSGPVVPELSRGNCAFLIWCSSRQGKKRHLLTCFLTPPLASPHLLKQRRKSTVKASGFSAEENWVGLEQLEQLRGSREQHPDPRFSDFLFPTVSSKLCFLYGNPLRKKFFIRKVAFCEGEKIKRSIFGLEFLFN